MRPTISAFLLLIATTVLASDDTQRLLDAPRVGDVLQLRIDRNKDAIVVNYRADNRFGGILRDNDTFATPGTIEITYKNLNPFLITTASAEAVAPDPNQKAIGDFLDALTAFGKGIVPSSTAAGAAPARLAPASARGTQEKCLKSFNTCKANAKSALDLAMARAGLEQATQPLLDQQKDAMTRCRTELEECLSCGAYDDLLKDAAALAGPPDPDVTADDLDRWIKQANGHDGIILARDEPDKGVRAKRQQVQNTIIALQKFNERFTTFMSVTDVCHTDIASQTSLAAGSANAARLLAANQQLLASLDAIIKMLNDYEQRNWRDGDTHASDLVISKVEGDAVQQKTITVTFRLQKYALDKTTNAITGAVDVEAKRAFVVRRYRLLVPEVGVAAVYNDVSYPKYSVKGTPGALTIDKTIASSNVDAAVTLNLLCNCVGGSFLYPGIQLGVSKAKDYPGILGGIVLRFAYPKQLSFAIGRMLTWYKDLDGTLTVDGPVASDADLQAHLKRRRAPTALYLAAQFNF